MAGVPRTRGEWKEVACGGGFLTVLWWALTYLNTCFAEELRTSQAHHRSSTLHSPSRHLGPSKPMTTNPSTRSGRRDYVKPSFQLRSVFAPSCSFHQMHPPSPFRMHFFATNASD
jgi:hypothetical protein